MNSHKSRLGNELRYLQKGRLGKQLRYLLDNELRYVNLTEISLTKVA